MNKYEIPTHLHVEDKLLGGLTVRQVLYVSVGLSLGYALWQHLQVLTRVGPAGVVLRVAICALPVLALLICGFAHPTGRPLEEWILAALRYATLPKVAVWRSVTHPEYGVDDENSDEPSGLAGAVANIASGDLPTIVDAQLLASAGEHDDGNIELPLRSIRATSDHSPSATRLCFRFRLAASERPGGPTGAFRLDAPGTQTERAAPMLGADQVSEKGQR